MSSKIKNKFKKIEAITRNIMNKIPETKDNDPLLYIEYLKEQGFRKAEEQIAAFILPNINGVYSYNGVSRARRKIQEEAKKNGDTSLLSTGQVMKLRRELEDEYYECFKK